MLINKKRPKKRIRTRSLVIIIVLVSLLLVSAAGYFTFTYLHNQQIEQAARDAEAARIVKEKAIAAAKEAKKKEAVYIALPNAKPVRAIVDDYTNPASVWALVNKTHAIPLDYIPAQLVLPDVEERTDKSVEERSVSSVIATPLKTMFTAAAVDGHALMIGSAYRSAALQKVYFDSYAAASGVEAANQYSAYPGQSEHQLGLSVDISTVSRNCYLDECFTSTPDGQWLADHAYEYGFTLRYPKGKEIITGYQFEPWHYRYVGIDLATALHESGLTFDEAWPYLQTALATLKTNGAI
jgi:D-alanyl-D-alanine carboxypeptidase